MIHVTISLVRHGETELNVSRIFQGKDSKLNLEGLEQAKKVGKRFTQKKVDLILASTHERANKTAKIIHEIVTKNQKEEIPFQETDLLGERGIGKLIGLSHMKPFEILEKNNIDYYKLPQPHFSSCLNEVSLLHKDLEIESLEDCNTRVESSVNYLFDSISKYINDSHTSKNPFHCVLVSHGLFLSGILGYLTLEKGKWFPIHFYNTSVSTINVEFQNIDSKYIIKNVVILNVNDVSHYEIK
jgi:broad specificity phosphatase PhoE